MGSIEKVEIVNFCEVVIKEVIGDWALHTETLPGLRIREVRPVTSAVHERKKLIAGWLRSSEGNSSPPKRKGS